MSQYLEMKKEERAIANLLTTYTEGELVYMNNTITQRRDEMFLELEKLKERQRLINKALEKLYREERENTVEFD